MRRSTPVFACSTQRHEAATVHMADAWARITGEIGIALVTGGPGHANAVGALYTALMAESPLVLISGHAPHDELGRGAFQEMRQADIAAPVVKASWTSASAAEIGADVARAVADRAIRPPWPRAFERSAGRARGSGGRGRRCERRSIHPNRAMLDETDANAILAQLARAKRPLILAGPASLTRAGRARLAALESATGIACIGMESPRGINDPCLGAFAEMLARDGLRAAARQAARFHARLREGARIRSRLRARPDRPGRPGAESNGEGGRRPAGRVRPCRCPCGNRYAGRAGGATSFARARMVGRSPRSN
jgi:thiamine pyrophosphate-dependent acetolactate synthase large subunit-like protein